MSTEETGKRVLYDASVHLDRGDYRAFLFLYDDHFLVIAVRVDQTDRVKRYTWKYEQVKHAICCNEETRSFLLIGLRPQPSGDEEGLDIMFSTKYERDILAFRIRTLARLYQAKDSIPIKTGKIYRSAPEIVPQPAKDKPLGIVAPIDDILSVENLQKLASAKSPTEITYDKKPLQLLVPIEVNAGASKYMLNAAAKMTLKVNIDIAELAAVQKTGDREERLKMIREMIHLDTSVCELTID